MATAHRDRMKQGVDALTEKEKHTLRLLLAGHDAKSMARHLGLSVHTVNERLRDARRKLSAASSKEAARLLREAEAPAHDEPSDEARAPDTVADKGLGDAGSAPSDHLMSQPDAAMPARHRAPWIIGGLAMLTLAVALLAVSPSPQSAPDRAAPSAATTAAKASAQSDATMAARQFLELVDAGKWEESWAATAQSFRSSNTVAAWRSASEGGRVPLGRVLSRSFTSEETIPAPPRGYQLVKFRTDFATKPGAVETLSLTREGGSWRVSGYLID